MRWDKCLERIVERQSAWEAKALAIVDGDSDADAKEAALDTLAVDAVADWWVLDDELTLRYGDGWEHEWAADGASKCKPLGYPDGWLEKVGFLSAAPPVSTVWTVERKLEQLAAATSK